MKITEKKVRALSELRKRAEGIEWHGRFIVIINRWRGGLAACPFCGGEHIHGSADGHRIAHCADTAHNYVAGTKAAFMNEKGEVFKQTDGYYVKTI